MKQLTSNITGPAQQVAELERKIKELKDAGAQQVSEVLSLKAYHLKEVEELKCQMTRLIDKRIHLADQLTQSKKSTTAIKEKYEALRVMKKGNIFNQFHFLEHSAACRHFYSYATCLIENRAG